MCLETRADASKPVPMCLETRADVLLDQLNGGANKRGKLNP
jgi:hypothetical protein